MSKRKYDYAKFIDNILSKLNLMEQLHTATIIEWINFFTFSREDMVIAKDIKIKSKTMAVFILNSISNVENLEELSNDMKSTLHKGISFIMKTIDLQEMSVEATQLLMKSITENPKSSEEIFEVFEKALSCENLLQQKIVIETLFELSDYEFFHRDLIELFTLKWEKKFFIKAKFWKFLSKKGLQKNSLKLLLKITQLITVELFSVEKWQLIKIALDDQTSAKDVGKIFDNMKLNFYEEIMEIFREDSIEGSHINKLKLNLSDNIRKIVKVLINEFDVDSLIFLDTACTHENENILKIASDFFLEHLKMKRNFSDMLPNLHYMLNECQSECGLSTLLRAFLLIPEEIVERFYDENRNELRIVNSFLRAFIISRNELVEKYSLDAVQRLLDLGYEIFPFVENVRDKILNGIKNLLKKESNDCLMYLQKLSALLAVPQWQLLNDDDLLTFYIHTWKEIKKGSSNQNLFMRLHTTLIRRILLKFTENQSMPSMNIFIQNFLSFKKSKRFSLNILFN